MLYIYISSSCTNTNIRHKETAHIRVLMRQEKTMKVIANHVLDPRIVIVPNAGAADRSWVWTAFDFSEGELVEKVINRYFLFSIVVMYHVLGVRYKIQ